MTDLIKRIGRRLATGLATLLLVVAPHSAMAQYTLETVVIYGSSCPAGWTCFSYVDSSGETALYAANYSRVAKTEAIAEVKASLRQTLRDIVTQAIKDYAFTCNPGLSIEAYLGTQVPSCVARVSTELARKTPAPLWPLFGLGGTTIQDRCWSELRQRYLQTPAAPCTATTQN